VSKPAALYIWSGMAFAIFATSQLKSWYGQERPFWISDEIQADGCARSFGNPSGHMLANTFIWVTVYLHAYYDIGIVRQRMSVFCTEYIIKMGVTAAGSTFLLFMAMSRVYLGMHTYN